MYSEANCAICVPNPVNAIHNILLLNTLGSLTIGLPILLLSIGVCCILSLWVVTLGVSRGTLTMATIQERKGKNGKISYRVQVRLKGHPPLVESFERKTDAKKWAASRESAIREGRQVASTEAQKHTVAEMIDRYVRDYLPRKKVSTRYPQRLQLEWWRDELGTSLLKDFTPSVITAARDNLLFTKTSNGKVRSGPTINRYLAVLSHCAAIASREWEWLPDNPVLKISKYKESKARVRFLSDDEQDRLLAACEESRNDFLYTIVLLALSTGMRRSEVMNLTWDAVDLNASRITLEDTKNDERRVVPLVGHAREAIVELSRKRRVDTRLLFPARYRHDRATPPIDIESAWRKALKRAELEDFRFHDLRHSAASYLAMEGCSPSEIAAVLGHKTLQMVKRYSHISDDHTADVVTRMNERRVMRSSSDISPNAADVDPR